MPHFWLNLFDCCCTTSRIYFTALFIAVNLWGKPKYASFLLYLFYIHTLLWKYFCNSGWDFKNIQSSPLILHTLFYNTRKPMRTLFDEITEHKSCFVKSLVKNVILSLNNTLSNKYMDNGKVFLCVKSHFMFFKDKNIAINHTML